MNLRSIYEQLGMEPEYDKEIAKFNNRIIIAVEGFNSSFYRKDGSIHERVSPFLIREVAFLIGESHIPSSLEGFFEDNIEVDDLEENILNLNCLLEASRKVLLLPEINQKDLYDFIVSEAKRTFELTPIDIGYLFSGDTIIKKGAKELDERLILENLMWLSNYPTVKQSFENSLKQYLGKNYPDAITNAYGSLEGLVKTFLNTDKRLDTEETRKLLINKLGLEKDWGQLLHYYSKLAHEFSSRHGKKETGEKLELAIELVEFYIYLTGTFMRLILTLSAK
jgi:hypothetical protein